MLRLKLKTKLLVTYIAAGAIPVIILGVISFLFSAASIEKEVLLKIASYKNVLSDMEATNSQNVGSMGRMVASDRNLIQAIKNNDLPGIKKSAENILATAPDLTFVTIADPTGLILARGHSDKAGDSMAGQSNFKSAIAGTPGVLMEDGQLVKLTIRGGFPIVDENNTLIGVISLGYSLATEKYVDHVKNLLGIECTIFSGDTRVATTIKKDDGSRATGTKMTNPQVIKDVLEAGQQFNAKNVILGQNYDTAYWPIKNESGQILGMFFIGVPTVSYEADQARALWVNVISVACTIILLSFIGWLIARSICNPINRATDALTDTIVQISEASKRIDGACYNLSESTSSQAAALEESAASLETLAGQATGNAENTREANSFMVKTQESAEEATVAMDEMMATMNNIRSSSDQVSGIIKAIEEIAFQTNLLALNAAVEAARAGEQGLGFAVVAEEVRNLAQRAGDAARNTASLITESVNYSRQGENVAERAASSIKATLNSTSEVANLLEEVGNASENQSFSINDISSAVGNMEQTVQKVAEVSQTAAEIAEELALQATSMEDVMFELLKVVDYNKALTVSTQRKGQEYKTAAKKTQQKYLR